MRKLLLATFANAATVLIGASPPCVVATGLSGPAPTPHILGSVCTAVTGAIESARRPLPASRVRCAVTRALCLYSRGPLARRGDVRSVLARC